MLKFIAGRLMQSVFVMLFVGAIAFTLFQFVGDPINQMVGEDATQAEREELRERLGLNDPLIVQFGRFAANAATGDFGFSYQHKRPVIDLIAERLPATLELAGLSIILALLVGIPMGVYTGLHRYGVLSKIFMTLSLIGVSLPTFLIGILFIYLFSVILGWLPSFGRGEVVDLGWWTTGFLTLSGWKAVILPAVTLALFQMTLVMRLVRAEMLEVMRTDYIKFARARGIANRAVQFRHALKNTLVPVITIIGLQLGTVIAFAIITETVFQWPGMGRLFLQGIQSVDIPIMSAYLVMIAFFFVVINLIVDILYYVVDPRLRIDSAKGAN
ncbi:MULTISPECIES: ABC transporter permease [Oceanibaculum]|uniref:Peptide/nickel transport system permease protein n=1 Tax=Oceanibaculum indicum TaxID=526216 RepID=A0A420WH44_9PROT|nr:MULTISPECIES: ABC transporter permease [Oceanibaculum]MCH2393253.1 ABC transporter permease [Oceanibaculum sp.]RKQ70330.1 peptide/nickel transport system permease protein [Oceanibaculum indicum]